MMQQMMMMQQQDHTPQMQTEQEQQHYRQQQHQRPRMVVEETTTDSTSSAATRSDSNHAAAGAAGAAETADKTADTNLAAQKVSFKKAMLEREREEREENLEKGAPGTNARLEAARAKKDEELEAKIFEFFIDEQVYDASEAGDRAKEPKAKITYEALAVKVRNANNARGQNLPQQRLTKQMFLKELKTMDDPARMYNKYTKELGRLIDEDGKKKLLRDCGEKQTTMLLWSKVN
mmetsp:Transcript_24888/g.59081  ORF Transcript_24888/g.59081 Transcript_24888/m.59081 type:complete len:234 (-) Transcript_24888:876-1577(-)